MTIDPVLLTILPILTTLLVESLKTGVDVIVKAGFEDSAKRLVDTVLHRKDKRLHQAAQQAIQRAAAKTVGEDEAYLPGCCQRRTTSRAPTATALPGAW
jgi:hypothetical protein